MLPRGPGESASTARMRQLAKIRSDIKAQAETETDPLIMGLKTEVKDQINKYFEKIHALDNAIKLFKHEYEAKKTYIQADGNLKHKTLREASDFVKENIRRFPNILTDEGRIAAIQAIDNAYSELIAIGAQKTQAELTAAFNEYESRLKSALEIKSEVIDNILLLLEKNEIKRAPVPAVVPSSGVTQLNRVLIEPGEEKVEAASQKTISRKKAKRKLAAKN